jgi:hypothetical protein
MLDVETYEQRMNRSLAWASSESDRFFGRQGVVARRFDKHPESEYWFNGEG